MLPVHSFPAGNASPAGNPHIATRSHPAGSRRHLDVAAPADCVVCSQLTDANERYFGRLMREARARTALAQTIATSMGFCPDHAAYIASPDSAAPHALDGTMREARRHLGSMLERTDLQDELLQDILFNARGRCPACAYFHRSEGRALARVLHGLESAARAPVPPLCFVHTQGLARRTEPPLRGRLVRLMRASARDAIAALDTPALSCGERVEAVRKRIYPIARRTALAQAPCACAVCTAIQAARSQWLCAVAENVRLEQPGWITLPTCHTHVLLCLDHADENVQRAALQRYLEAALPARQALAQDAGSAPKRRRRNKVRWFDAAAHAAPMNGAAPASHATGTLLHEPCPGCDTEEIAARRAIALLIRKVSRTNDEDATVLTSGLCLKHFAEALIYASDPAIEHRLRSALCRTLHRDGQTPASAPTISACAGHTTGHPSHRQFPVPVVHPCAG